MAAAREQDESKGAQLRREAWGGAQVPVADVQLRSEADVAEEWSVREGTDHLLPEARVVRVRRHQR